MQKNTKALGLNQGIDNNPFWRMETSGSYMLLFNAALNFNHLSPR